VVNLPTVLTRKFRVNHSGFLRGDFRKNQEGTKKVNPLRGASDLRLSEFAVLAMRDKKRGNPVGRVMGKEETKIFMISRTMVIDPWNASKKCRENKQIS